MDWIAEEIHTSTVGRSILKLQAQACDMTKVLLGDTKGEIQREFIQFHKLNSYRMECNLHPHSEELHLVLQKVLQAVRRKCVC